MHAAMRLCKIGVERCLSLFSLGPLRAIQHAPLPKAETAGATALLDVEDLSAAETAETTAPLDVPS